MLLYRSIELLCGLMTQPALVDLVDNPEAYPAVPRVPRAYETDLPANTRHRRGKQRASNQHVERVPGNPYLILLRDATAPTAKIASGRNNPPVFPESPRIIIEEAIVKRSVQMSANGM